MKGQVKTAFYFLIDHRIRDHIIKCTEEEAFRVSGTMRDLDATKLDAFIALLYAPSAYQAKYLDVSYLWNKIWRLAFLSKTMNRNDVLSRNTSPRHPARLANHRSTCRPSNTP